MEIPIQKNLIDGCTAHKLIPKIEIEIYLNDQKDRVTKYTLYLYSRYVKEKGQLKSCPFFLYDIAGLRTVHSGILSI